MGRHPVAVVDTRWQWETPGGSGRHPVAVVGTRWQWH